MSMKPSRQQRRRGAVQARRKARQQAAQYVPSEPMTLTWKGAAGVVWLTLLVAGCYLPSILWGSFVWDDNHYLVDIEPVRAWSGLWQIWSSPAALNDYYWPLTYTTFWVEHKLWGFNPTGYHIVNVLLHLANTLLVWQLMRRLAVPGAQAIAAVFAVHPLHVESVAWIIERKDVLSGLFYLAAVLFWMRFSERPKARYYAGSLSLYAAALLSKLSAVTLPAGLLLWHWWKAKPVDWVKLFSFFVVGLAIAWVNIARRQDIGTFATDYSFIERTLIAARALCFYVGKLLWPTNLAVIYPRWDVSVADMLAWGFLAACVAVVVVLWLLRHRIGRGPGAGVSFFAVTLSPVLGFVDHHYMTGYSFVADRFQYLAGLGVIAVVCGAASHGACRLPDWGCQGARFVTAAVLVMLSALTWQQACVWKNSETLWRHVIALNPQPLQPYLGLSAALNSQRRYEEAVEVARVAVDKAPNSDEAHSNLGRALFGLDRYEEAELHLRQAVALDPQRYKTHFVHGAALGALGRFEEAIASYNKALVVQPGYQEARKHRDALVEAIRQVEALGQ